MGTIENRERVFKIPSYELYDSAKRALKVVRDRVHEGTPNEIGNTLQTVLHEPTETLFQLSYNKLAKSFSIEYITFDHSSGKPELTQLPSVPDSADNLQSTLGAWETYVPNLADEFDVVEEKLSDTSAITTITADQYNEIKGIAYKTDLISGKMRAPFVAAGKRIVESATTIRRRLNPFGV